MKERRAMSEVKKYLVTFRPLGPFAFGTEQNFKFEGVGAKGKVSYYVRTSPIPEQTTLLGSLRYAVLAGENCINSSFAYTPEEKARIQELVGQASFDFNQTDQSFGRIKSLSPLFLINDQNEYIVKNPVNNTSNQGVKAIELGEEILTSQGLLSLPQAGQYDGKAGMASGYINLQTGQVYSDLFQSFTMVGNRKNDGLGDKEEGFFKQEVHCIKEGFKFAVMVEAEDFPAEVTVRMGQEGSPFVVEAKEIDENDLEKKVKSQFEKIASSSPWYYALSDLIVSQVENKGFCMINKKSIRNITTDYSKAGRKQALSRSMVQQNMVAAGSVYYDHKNVSQINFANQNHKQIGYNYLIKIGGE